MMFTILIFRISFDEYSEVLILHQASLRRHGYNIFHLHCHYLSFFLFSLYIQLYSLEKNLKKGSQKRQCSDTGVNLTLGFAGDTQVESGLNSAPLASSSKLEKAEESADEALKNKKDGKEESETGTKDDESEEPVETITLQNPTRCSPEHSASVHFIKNGRYQPLDRTVPPFGIIIVRDTQPGISYCHHLNFPTQYSSFTSLFQKHDNSC